MPFFFVRPLARLWVRLASQVSIFSRRPTFNVQFDSCATG
jgi:hypothetical protein